MAADGSVIIEIDGDDSKFRKSISSLGSVASGALKGVTTAIAASAAAIAGLAVGATKVGMAFETSMAGTSTMFGDVAVDTKGLTDQILSLSSATGVAATDLSNSLYNALSAGIPVTEDMTGAMGYMDQCVKLAAAGFTDVDTAVTATAKVMNAYGMSLDDVDSIQKIMLQTQNKGITTVDELGASLAQVTPTAAAMGVSFENVGAALATMTAQGTPTAQATTQLNSLLAELGKSGTKASNILKEKTGKSFKALMEEGYSLSEVLSLMQVDLSGSANAISKLMSEADVATGKTMTFEEACAQLGVSSDAVNGELIDMFGSLEAGKAALAMAGDNSAAFSENLAAMSTEADVVGDAYAKMTDTLESKIGILKESVTNLGIAVYAGMSEPLKNAATAATGLVAQVTDAFTTGGLPAAVEALGSVVAQAATGIAQQAPAFIQSAVDLLQAFVGGIVDSLPQLIPAAGEILGALVGGIMELLPQLADAAAQLITSLSDYVIANVPQMIPAAVETIATLVENLTDNFDQIIDAGIAMLVALGEGIIAALPTLIEKIPEIVINIADAINNNAPKLLTAALRLIVELGAGLIKNIPTLILNIPKIIEAIVKAFMAFNWLKLGGSLIKGLSSGVKNAASFAKEAAGNIVNTIKTKIKELPKQLLSVGKDIVKGLANGIKDGAKWAIDAIGNLAKNMLNKVTDFFKIKSPSHVMRDQVGKMLPLGAAGGVEDETPKAVKSARRMSEKIRAAAKIELASPVWDKVAASAQIRRAFEQESFRVSASLTGGQKEPKGTPEGKTGLSFVINVYPPPGTDTEKAHDIGREIGAETAREMRRRGLVPT